MMRGPTPTSEEKRREAEQQRRAENMRLMNKHFTQTGAGVRPSLGNLIAALTHFEAWKDVLAVNGTILVFAKEPPWHEDVKPEAPFEAGAEVSQRDIYRMAVWLEREAHILIENADQLQFLWYAVEVVARKKLFTRTSPK